MKEYLKKNWWGLCIAILVGAFSFKAIIFLHFERIDELAMISYSPINGEAFWRAFQNRFFSAWLMEFVMLAGGLSMIWAFKVWLLILLVSINLFIYTSYQKLGVAQHRLFGFIVLFNLLFIFLQDHRWIMLWDAVDILLFFLFYYGLLSNKPWYYFVIIFSVGILNREAAMYMALWFVIDGAYPYFTHPRNYNYKKIALGAALLGIGGYYTMWSRATFFVKSYAPYVGYDLENEVTGNHLNFVNNLQSLKQNIISVQLDMLATIFVIFLGIIFWINRKYLDDFLKKLAILFLAIITSIWVFGLINETRLYLIYIPGFMALIFKLYNKERPFFYL